jgi:hypothetical protein
MSARGHIKGDDRISINDISKSRRSPLKRVFGKRQQRSSSAPARMRKHLLVEEHYRVDPVDKRLLPGLPVSDEDWARDLHDFFNLVALVSKSGPIRCTSLLETSHRKLILHSGPSCGAEFDELELGKFIAWCLYFTSHHHTL